MKQLLILLTICTLLSCRQEQKEIIKEKPKVDSFAPIIQEMAKRPRYSFNPALKIYTCALDSGVYYTLSIYANNRAAQTINLKNDRYLHAFQRRLDKRNIPYHTNYYLNRWQIYYEEKLYFPQLN